MVTKKLEELWRGEEELREKAKEIVTRTLDLQLHLKIIEKSMDIADLLRRVGSDEEDIKVLRVIGMRTFNGFASSLKLALGGYSQNAAMILRDVLESAFLLDYFRSFPDEISVWRLADEKERQRKFRPVHIRIALDERDGLDGMKRAEKYAQFSQMAGHPTMKSDWMLRPQKDGDAHSGPFIADDLLTAIIEESGMLAAQIGTYLSLHIPLDSGEARHTVSDFRSTYHEWYQHFLR